MRSNFKTLFAHSTSLKHIEEQILNFFAQVRKKHSRIGYVAGVVTSDRPDKIELNRKKLIGYTKMLEEIFDFPLFCAVDIFSNDVYEKLEEMKFEYKKREEKFALFWGGGYKFRTYN